MIFKFINLPVFLISFAFGTLFVYLSSPPHKVVYVYPTPDNSGQVEYVDKADNCFQFNPIEMNCPSNDANLKEIPVQN